MNVSSICFYISVFYFSYLEYIGDHSADKSFSFTVILGLIAILNRR